MRPAGMADAARLLAWRNDPVTRAMSADTAEVDLAAHMTWLERSLARTDRLLFVGEATRTDEPVGTLRLDQIGPGVWEVSIAVAPELRGLGWSGKLLGAGVTHMAGVALTSRVRADNDRSLRLFEEAGFARVGEVDGFVFFRREAP
nr:GNAT family protein [Caulobacter sp. 17J65-9]